MQFYCQNMIRPKKDTKLCLRVEKWSTVQVGITSFFYFIQSLLNPLFCVVFMQNTSMFLFMPRAFSSTNNFTHVQMLYRMSSLCRSYECMNIARVNIGVLTGWKKIKQRCISFVYVDIMKNFNCNQYKTSNIGNF